MVKTKSSSRIMINHHISVNAMFENRSCLWEHRIENHKFKKYICWVGANKNIDWNWVQKFGWIFPLICSYICISCISTGQVRNTENARNANMDAWEVKKKKLIQYVLEHPHPHCWPSSRISPKEHTNVTIMYKNTYYKDARLRITQTHIRYAYVYTYIDEPVLCRAFSYSI